MRPTAPSLIALRALACASLVAGLSTLLTACDRNYSDPPRPAINPEQRLDPYRTPSDSPAIPLPPGPSLITPRPSLDTGSSSR